LAASPQLGKLHTSPPAPALTLGIIRIHNDGRYCQIGLSNYYFEKLTSETKTKISAKHQQQ